MKERNEMTFAEMARYLHDGYELGYYDPDDLNSIEEWMSLDPSERQGYPDRMREEMEEEEWHEEN